MPEQVRKKDFAVRILIYEYKVMLARPAPPNADTEIGKRRRF
jgi:hypothetical protein